MTARPMLAYLPTNAEIARLRSRSSYETIVDAAREYRRMLLELDSHIREWRAMPPERRDVKGGPDFLKIGRAAFSLYLELRALDPTEARYLVDTRLYPGRP